MNTLQEKKKSATESVPKKQWDQLIGKRVEIITKIGYLITGWAESSQAQVLTITDASVMRQGASEIERQLKPVHIGCEYIAVAIEM